MCYILPLTTRARLAELANALGLGPNAARLEGSSPSPRTIFEHGAISLCRSAPCCARSSSCVREYAPVGSRLQNPPGGAISLLIPGWLEFAPVAGQKPGRRMSWRTGKAPHEAMVSDKQKRTVTDFYGRSRTTGTPSDLSDTVSGFVDLQNEFACVSCAFS